MPPGMQVGSAFHSLLHHLGDSFCLPAPFCLFELLPPRRHWATTATFYHHLEGDTTSFLITSTVPAIASTPLPPPLELQSCSVVPQVYTEHLPPALLHYLRSLPRDGFYRYRTPPAFLPTILVLFYLPRFGIFCLELLL